MQGPFLTAGNLACRKGDRLLFRGVDLAMTAGDAMHITGPNGSGKTSLMRILAGLAIAFEGTCKTGGAIGMIDDRLPLDTDDTLARAMRFWHRVDNTFDGTAPLAAMGLSSLADVPVRYLSTGQRKRAAFALLLSRAAPIWLLDEPLNGLDDQARMMVEEAIAAHCRDGGICIAASHQPIALPHAQTLCIAENAP